MKILCATPMPLPSRSVSSFTVSKTAEAFAILGHAVTLYGKHGGKDDVNAHYNLHKDLKILAPPAPNIPLLGTILHSRKIVRLALQEQYSILYSRGIWPLYFTRNKNIDLIFEAHMPAGNALYHHTMTKVFSAPNFRRLIVISNKLKEMYLEAHPQLKDKEIVLARLASEPPAESKNEREWPGRAGHPQIGYIGGLYQGRGIELICRIAGKLPDMDFHFVGGGRDKGYFERKLGNLPANITFHGFTNPGKLSGIYQRLDILLAPYQADAKTMNNKPLDYFSPTKLFEYMAAKKAIVASDLPIIREVLNDGEEFLLASPNDAGAWAEAITKLAADKELYSRLVAAAFERFNKEFTWKQRARTILEGL